MGNLLEIGLRSHYSGLRRAAGVVAIYSRGNSSVEINPIPGRFVGDQYGDDGAVYTARLHDFIVVGKITLDGAEIDPEIGDKITYDGREFSVSYAPGDGAWRFADTYKTAIRIHTVETGVS